MPLTVRRSALVVALSLVGAARPVLAQVGVEVAATLGYYSPLSSFRPAASYSSDLPHSPGDLAGVAYGAQLRLWLSSRIGLELEGTTSASIVGGGPTPEGEARTTSARISSGSMLLLYQLTRRSERAHLWLGAGGGAIQHGGRTYEPYGRPVNFAAVVGLGSAIRISGGLSANVGVTSMIYDLDIRGTPRTDGGVRERGRQVDMLMQTGLSYRLR